MLQHGIYPFWFWNGDISEEEIKWQIQEMAAKGIRGFFIHPRQGLKQPYLSESFFQKVAIAVQAAEAAGLIVHLYDEYPYPSGVAGGAVTLGNPHFHATGLQHARFDEQRGYIRLELPLGKVLACTAYPVSDGQLDWDRGMDLRTHVGPVLAVDSYNEVGLTQYNRKRYFASQPTPTLEVTLPPGTFCILATVQTVVERHKYWWHFVDVLNPEAVRTFLQLTHAQYDARFGDKFGRTIYSIFVDETEPYWSARVPAEFLAEYDYDLLPLLPALQDDNHPKHLQVKFDLTRLIYKLFCQTFETTIAQWCAEHNLKYSGEKPSLRLAQLRYMDIPGCEPGHTKAGAPMDLLRPRLRQNARATASAAYFYEKEGALCECFHSVGWSGTLQDAKLMSEGLLLMGIKYLVPHGFFYTTHGLAKHDAPPTFFFQMPYWPLFKHLTQRLDRIATHFEGTYIEARVLLVDPAGGLPSKVDLDAYERLLDTLMAAHLDFLIVDTDILEAGTVKNKQLQIRDIAAELIVVPPMQMVETELSRRLKALEAAGVRVLRPSPSFDQAEFVRNLTERVRPALELNGKQGDLSKLQIVSRTDGTRRLWFILNTGDEKLEVEFRPATGLREITLEPTLPSMLSKEADGYRRTIHPFESILLEAVADKPLITPPPILTIPVNGPAEVVTKNRNLLRMYDWQMALLDETGTPGQWQTVPAVPLANQLAHGSFRFAPTIETFFGSAPELRLPPLNVQYQFYFASDYSGAVELVMEPGSIGGDWQLQINDSADIKMADFHKTEAHVRGSLGLDVTPYLRQGNNVITLSLRTNRLDGGLRNPLYLAGDFGVELAPLRLVERQLTGEFEAWEANGLPFYAGVVEYTTSFELGRLPDDDPVLVEVDHGIPFQEASEISINGGPWRPLLWSPYRLLLPIHELREGSNILRTRVYTTLIRAFEGQSFDIEIHAYREVSLHQRA